MESGSYGAVDGTELKLDIFRPEQANGTTIVFFFGGGWRDGTTEQFHPQCLYLNDYGLIGISAEYRVRSRHGTSIPEAVADARELMNWFIEHGESLKINTDRLIVGGGSAGGQLALCTAFDSPLVPQALVLFNPVYDTSLKRIADMIPSELVEKYSPQHNVGPGFPPTILFHGTKDNIVPFSLAEKFTKKMEEYDNYCELVAFKDEQHAFFNYGQNENKAFKKTMEDTVNFLNVLGLIKT
ncbi:MAG: alpha/beta hydrolase [Deltaproteobacteria bacterium]|nr:alpha/beta hydrolase [Deltaproteobacteria bacterium]